MKDAYHVATETEYIVTGAYCMFCGAWVNEATMDAFWLDLSSLVVCGSTALCWERWRQQQEEQTDEHL